MTDTETVRMLEALVEFYDESVEFSSSSTGGVVLVCERMKNPPVAIHVEEAEDIPHATAEAYKAMLEEKR